MVKELRQQFNKNFTEEKYLAYVKQFEDLYHGQLDFRIAETPIFVPKDFRDKMFNTCERIIDLVIDPRFKSRTQKSIPPSLNVPNENDHPHFWVFDFGVCENKDHIVEPQLVEMQGFPTLFSFQAYHSAFTRKYASPPPAFDSYLNGYDEPAYIRLLKEIIIGDAEPENVILLEIFPEQQKTKLDFYCTEELLGIRTVCITSLIAEGDRLFYKHEGNKIEIKRIYNRIIFDDLLQQENLSIPDLTYPWNVRWITHPNWFYRISKYTLPFIHDPYVPETFFLGDIKQLPPDLENYVLKPLFSFAGTGVVIDVTLEDLEKIEEPERWILQRKVKYAEVIETTGSPAKAEIRIFYLWKDGWDRPVAVHNLTRLSKGKMIGTRFNRDQTWVGTSVAFIEK